MRSDLQDFIVHLEQVDKTNISQPCESLLCMWMNAPGMYATLLFESEPLSVKQHLVTHSSFGNHHRTTDPPS